jgi:sulfide:quinone oxidoreductase
MKPQILILGAGFAGHTATLHLSYLVRGKADVTVVAPKNRFTWFPSLIWVGTGTMREEETVFALKPVYDKIGVAYIDARAKVINVGTQTVTIEDAGGTASDLHYDYLVNATGPYLNFEGTPGLGPVAGNTMSVCTVEHAVETRERYLEIIRAAQDGKRQRIVVGVGHPAATCEGAGFEYLMNVHADLKRRGVRDAVDLTWLTNEPEFGDFGVDGIEALKGGMLVRGASLVRMVLDESHIHAISGVGVTRVEPGKIFYERVGDEPGSIEFDFAMLLPQFRGIPMRYVDGAGTDVTESMTMPSGFMRVDANYEPKSYDAYRADDWPALYRSPFHDNVYAVGIAFAPPHPISRGKKTPSGLAVVATPPRTGMASGIMGRAVAENIALQVDGKPPDHHARMSEMPAACIASMGKSLFSGSAASIIMTPVVRDFERYPKYGRDIKLCELDVGLNGAWTKRLLHSAFLWKLQAKPGWQLIPE